MSNLTIGNISYGSSICNESVLSPFDTYSLTTNLYDTYNGINKYTKPIKTIEKNNSKILQYNICGMSDEDINVEKEFINKTKELFLNVTGEYEDEESEFKTSVNIHLPIDTKIYELYDFYVLDGLLTITLFEIENEEPEFKCVSDEL
jgi:hypothetical protein